MFLETWKCFRDDEKHFCNMILLWATLDSSLKVVKEQK